MSKRFVDLWKKYVRGTMVCTIYYGVGLTKDSSKAQKADKKGKKSPLACAKAYIQHELSPQRLYSTRWELVNVPQECEKVAKIHRQTNLTTWSMNLEVCDQNYGWIFVLEISYGLNSKPWNHFRCHKKFQKLNSNKWNQKNFV